MKIESIIAIILSAINAFSLLTKFSLKLKIKSKAKIAKKIDKLNKKMINLMKKEQNGKKN